jgi:ribonuclease HI
MTERITIYTDGGARGNPGPAGAGVVIADERGNVLKRTSKALGTQTNNWAEYEAVILGLQTLKRLVGSKKLKDMEVSVLLDSELVARQLNNTYQIKEDSLFPQYIRVHNMLVADFPRVSFMHISREKNKEADKLANKAIDEMTDLPTLDL